MKAGPKHRVTLRAIVLEGVGHLYLECDSCSWFKKAGAKPTPAKLEKLARVHRADVRRKEAKARKDKLRTYPLSDAQRDLITDAKADQNTKRIPAYPSKAV